MTIPDEMYRNACRRHNRVVAAFLAIEAWRHGCDAVVIQEKDFKNIFDLKNLKNSRLKWFLDDAKDWFPVAKSHIVCSPLKFVPRKVGDFKKKETLVLVLARNDVPYVEKFPILELADVSVPDYKEATLISSILLYAFGFDSPSMKVRENNHYLKELARFGLRKMAPKKAAIKK